MMWLQIIKSVYGKDVSVNFIEAILGQNQILDLVKNWKHQTITPMIVSGLNCSAAILW